MTAPELAAVLAAWGAAVSFGFAIAAGLTALFGEAYFEQGLSLGAVASLAVFTTAIGRFVR